MLGKSLRMGADIRIKCEGCGHSVLIPRREFEKKMKRLCNAIQIKSNRKDRLLSC